MRSERRMWASRVPELSVLEPKLRAFSKANRPLPLLYIEFANLDAPRNGVTKTFRLACKQATAAALNASIGSVLRKEDLVACGRGGEWFVALLTGPRATQLDRRLDEARLGLAARRLKSVVEEALRKFTSISSNSAISLNRVAVRSGWNVIEPASDSHQRESLRQAIRGAAVLARVEERRAHILAAISHELRTPLTAIIGFAERLQSSNGNARERRHHLSIIAREARRLKNLTEGLVDLSAWNAGALSPNIAKIDLAAITRRAIRQINDEARSRGIRIEQNGRGQAWADRDRVTQVLTNLLDNAMRHTPDGGKLQVKLRQKRSEALIQVEDSGSGFPAELKTSLGTPFSKGSNGRIGLGLAICTAIIEAHGGKLQFGQSSLGGAKVSAVLPLNSR